MNFRSIANDTLICKLINSIYLEKVDSAFKYYYLLDTSKNPEFDKYSIIEVQKILKEKANHIPLNEFLKSIETDTSIYVWTNKCLLKARCVSQKNLPYKYHRRYVHVNKKWSLQKQKKKLEQQNANYEKIPREERTWYFFSKPIFSDNKQFVLISLGGRYGRLLGECLYIFESINGNWIQIYKFECSQS